MFTGTSHLIGYGWSDDAMHLRLRTWPDGNVAPDLRLQGQLRFRLTGQTQCVGYYDFGSGARASCPEKATPDKKSQCDACIEREGFATWMRCNGRDIPPLLPAVRTYIESPHFLYLANFGDDQVKVGMASSTRKAERLLEQGPAAAMYVAQGSGIAIRQLEVDVSRLGLLEFVRRSRKLKLLSESCSLAASLVALQQAFTQIRAQLGEEYQQLWLPEPQPFAVPSLAQKARQQRNLEIIEPVHGQIVEGEVLAASGSVVIINDGGLPTAIDLGEIVGSVIEFNPSGQVERAAKQMGLF